MKKLFFISACIYLAAGCNKDLSSLNIDQKNPSIVPSYTLFSNAEKNLATNVADANVNNNIFRLITQQWTETTYTDESNYDLNTRNIPQNLWNTMYRDVLRDFEETKRLSATQVLDPVTRQNDTAITDIMEVYTWYYLVTTYGNIPYFEALDINRTAPKYDDQRTIYMDLLRRLNADIAALNVNGESFGNADVIYNGDVRQWKKFANTFKVKMGMTIAD